MTARPAGIPHKLKSAAVVSVRFVLTGIGVAVAVGVGVLVLVGVAVVVGVGELVGVAVGVGVLVGAAAGPTETWSICGELWEFPVRVAEYCRYRPAGLMT